MWRNTRETYDAAKKGLQTNYYGTKHVIEALLPLLQASSDGRIVNVSSDFGLLRVTSFDHLLFQILAEYQCIIVIYKRRYKQETFSFNLSP